MTVKVVFKAKDIVNALNTEIDNEEIEIVQSDGQLYADCLFNVVECIKQDLLEMLQDDASTMPSTKEYMCIVADKNKVMLPSLINGDTDNIIRSDTRERIWQIDRYWRNGVSCLPSDYASIRKILPRYLDDIDCLEVFYNNIIDRAFKVIEDIIKELYSTRIKRK